MDQQVVHCTELGGARALRCDPDRPEEIVLRAAGCASAPTGAPTAVFAASEPAPRAAAADASADDVNGKAADLERDDRRRGGLHVDLSDVLAGLE